MMIEIKRKFVYASPLIATVLIGIAFIAWPGPFLPEAIRGLAPHNTLLAELSQGSDALARRRGGGRGGSGGGGGFKRSGPSSYGSVHTSRGRQSSTKWSSGGSRGSFQRVDRGGRGGRRDTRPDQRGDRREFRQDVRKERRDVRKERHEWYEDRWRRRGVSALLTVAAFRALTCASRTVIVNGVSYYGCGTTWYNRAYQSGQVVYVIVTPPPGY